MSKIIVPLHLANLAQVPSGADAGFKKLYLRANWMKLHNGSSESDLVLDRPLDNFNPTAGTITALDTVLTALEKLQYSISSIPIPDLTLQEVTDNGNTTTNTIDIAGFTAGYAFSDGWGLGVKDEANTFVSELMPYVGLVTYNDDYNSLIAADSVTVLTNNGLNYSILSADGALALRKNGGSIGTLSINPLTQTRSWNLPNASGTIALTSDILSLDLQQVTDNGNSTSNTISINNIDNIGLEILSSGNGVGLNIETYGGLTAGFYNENGPVISLYSSSSGVGDFITATGGYDPGATWGTRFKVDYLGNTTAKAFITQGGTTSQYIKGDGSLGTFPTIPTVGTWGALNYPTWTSGTPFVKMTAAGTFSLDTNTYLTGITSSDVTTALGYTPVTNARTITINGVSYDLSANRSWTIPTFTSPLTTKGDLFTYSTTNARLPIGLDTQVLIADSTQATGMKWGSNTAPTQLGYYGSWQDTNTQTAAVSNTGYPMIFRTTDLSNGVSVVTNGTNLTRITFANTGIYNLQFSSQFQNTGNSQEDITIWLRLNGVDVPGTSGFISIPARKSAGAGNEGHGVYGWNYVLSVVGGQYYELVWSTSNASNVTMQYYAAGSPPPSAASVIMTVTQQSGIMAGTGLTAINSLTGAVQTLTTGTSGTDFAISSSGTTHTFNLPTASASNTGKLSSTDWSTFNGKQDALSYVPLKFQDLTVSTITPSTVQTIISSVFVPGNTFAASQEFKLEGAVSRTSPTLTPTVRFYINTTNSLTGATQLAVFSGNTTNTYIKLSRQPVIRGGFLRTTLTTTSLQNDNTASTSVFSPTAFAYDVTQGYYFMFVVNYASAGTDTYTHEFLTLRT